MLAYAEDHAALLEAFVTLAEVDDVRWLVEARSVADALLELFADEPEAADDPEAAGSGGFFTTGSDAETLIVRAKDLFDNATPAENSLAAHGLFRLSALTGEQRYEAAAVGTLRLVRDAMAQQPSAFSYALAALERYLTPPLEVAIVGGRDQEATRVLRREVWRRQLPAAVRVAAEPDEGRDLTPLLADRPLVDGVPTAFVCERFACRLPVTTPDQLRTQLDGALRSR